MMSLRPFLALAAAGVLAGCSTVESLIPHNDTSISTVPGDPQQKTGRPGANPSEKPVVLPVATADINCPEVDIADGKAAYRVGGADSASVRYQFNILDTARECDPAGPGQAMIRVGVAGNLIIGPAGSPGAYSVPLQITVTQDADNKQIYSKTYKVEATADATNSSEFRIVADPIPVPMPTLQLASIYTITVGLEGGGAGAAPRGHRRRVPG